jgi:hypothetical protein
MSELKLAKLPDRTPVKLTVTVSPELNRALQTYASLYREAYGQEESVGALIPFMLESFLEADRSFKKSVRKQENEANGSSPRPQVKSHG